MKITNGKGINTEGFLFKEVNRDSEKKTV